MELKIAIIDDEYLIVETLEKLVPKVLQEAKLIGHAFNSDDAYKLIKYNEPDIAIVDIRLPSISGIELIKKLKDEGCNTYFIILTAFREFSYAQSAITLGVSDYLLKPIQYNRLKNCLNKVKNNIFSANDDKKKLNKYDEMLPKFVKLKLKDIINNTIDLCKIDMKSMKLYLDIDKGIIMYVIPLNRLKIEKINECINNYQEILDYNKAGLIFYIDSERSIEKIVILINDSFKNRTLVVNLKGELISILGDEITLYESDKIRDINELKDTYQTLLKLIDQNFYYCKQGCILNINQFNCKAFEQNYKYALDNNRILTLIQEKKQDEVENLLKQEFNKIKHNKINKNYYPHVIYNVYLNLFKECCRCLELSNTTKLEISSLHTSDVAIYYNIDLFENYVINMIKKIFLEISRDNNLNDNDRIIMMVKNYCYKNYYRDIALDDVANHVNMSKNYFCTYFKKHTNINFYDYLICLRMDVAKKLLVNTNKKINEIASEVGYGSPSHFGKIFKKIFGSTPLKYRNDNTKI